MGGFRFGGFFGRVPCPHCGSTDCAASEPAGDARRHICVRTRKPVDDNQLLAAAAAAGLARYREVPLAGGWTGLEVTSGDRDGIYVPGSVVLQHDRTGARGTAPTIEAATDFAQRNIDAPAAVVG